MKAMAWCPAGRSSLAVTTVATRFGAGTLVVTRGGDVFGRGRVFGVLLARSSRAATTQNLPQQVRQRARPGTRQVGVFGQVGVLRGEAIVLPAVPPWPMASELTDWNRWWRRIVQHCGYGVERREAEEVRGVAGVQ